MQTVKKITVISDTHGVIDEQIVPFLKDSDMIIHAGDIMSTDIIKKLRDVSLIKLLLLLGIMTFQRDIQIKKIKKLYQS